MGAAWVFAINAYVTKLKAQQKNLVDSVQNSEPNNQLKICVNSAQTDLIIDL